MDINLITNRRREVEGEISRLKSRLGEMQAELVELDTAERVVARLTGAERPTSGAADESESAATASRKPDDIPTMPEMILAILTDAWGRDQSGLAPKDITAEIARRWWPDVRGESVSSIAWRMKDRGQLDKQGTVYMVPQKEKAVDDEPDGNTSTALFSNPQQQGREAGPGGGT